MKLVWSVQLMFASVFFSHIILFQPYGMDGGEPGERGRNLLIRNNGVVVNMGGRCSGDWHQGERLRIETPGAGGYGAAS
jgi:N-methylhydantoinase B/oxoprolinase/acetone carboxylase alpha subunit